MTRRADVPPDDTLIVLVANSCRHAWHRQYHDDELVAWKALGDDRKLAWIEVAHAAISTWLICRDRFIGRDDAP